MDFTFQGGAAGEESKYNSSTSAAVSCQLAHLQCSFRSGCGSTLLSFNFECHDLVSRVGTVLEQDRSTKPGNRSRTAAFSAFRTLVLSILHLILFWYNKILGNYQSVCILYMEPHTP